MNILEEFNKKQLKDSVKVKFCDFVVVNDKNIKILKINVKLVFPKNKKLSGNNTPNNRSSDSNPITPNEVRKKIGNIINFLPSVFGNK